MPKIMYKGKNYSMGNGSEVDSVLSSTSENPVQNKVVTEALDNKLNVGDIADWAKADEKPAYTASEVGADIQGAADTALSSAKSYTDTKVSDLVNGAPETLDTLKEIADAMSDNKDVVEALDIAVGSKANASDLTAHINNKNNPHEVSKSDIGLGNVENKSSETIRSEITKENVVDALGFTPSEGGSDYELPIATSENIGGVKIGYTTNGKNYPVQLSDGQMYVNVPWTDTNTTYSTVTTSTNGLATPALMSAANNALPKSGGTMTGKLVCQSNAEYTTAQSRNITMSTSAPSGGSNGQIHFQYS